MTNQLPLVLVGSDNLNDGSLQLDDGDTVQVGTTRWFSWLEENSSFRFESGFAGQDSFTARKHERDSGAFWYAYRKLGKKLCNAYLGKSERVTVDRMVEVAAKLSQPKPEPQQLSSGYAPECITVPLQRSNDSEPTDKQIFPTSIIEGGAIRWNVYESVEGYSREQKKNAWGEWRLIGSYKTEYEADKSIASRKEHNHRLNSDKGDYGIVGLRFEKRSEVIAPATADITVTPTAKELLLAVEQLRSELMAASAENAAKEAEVKKWVQSSAQAQYQLDDVVAERDQLRLQLEDMAAKVTKYEQRNSQPDLDATRDRVLAGLKLGKQAPEYKRTKAALERFIELLGS